MKNYKSTLVLTSLLIISGCIAHHSETARNALNTIHLINDVSDVVSKVAGPQNPKSCEEVAESKQEECREKADALAESISRQKKKDNP